MLFILAVVIVVGGRRNVGICFNSTLLLIATGQAGQPQQVETEYECKNLHCNKCSKKMASRQSTGPFVLKLPG